MKTTCSYEKLAIPHWGAMDRPREKYLAKGFASLSDAELIAILLRSGSKEKSAVDLAKNLLLLCDQKLELLSEMSVEELVKVKGIGMAKAVNLHVAFELGRRRRAEKVVLKKKIKYADDIWELMQAKIADLSYEEFWAIFVNQSSTILRTDLIGRGGITSTTVDIRLIMRIAIESFATGIILCHNHPSGEVTPSKQDIQLTAQIKKAADLFNITIVDHLIINKNHYYSFHKEGILY